MNIICNNCNANNQFICDCCGQSDYRLEGDSSQVDGDLKKIRRLLLDINEQATRKDRGCKNKPYLITDLEIIGEKVRDLLSKGFNSVEISKKLDKHEVTIRNIKRELKKKWHTK